MTILNEKQYILRTEVWELKENRFLKYTNGFRIIGLYEKCVHLKSLQHVLVLRVEGKLGGKFDLHSGLKTKYYKLVV